MLTSSIQPMDCCVGVTKSLHRREQRYMAKVGAAKEVEDLVVGGTSAEASKQEGESEVVVPKTKGESK